MPNYESDQRLAAANKVLAIKNAAGMRWAAIVQVAAETGCSATTLWRWVRLVEKDRQRTAGR